MTQQESQRRILVVGGGAREHAIGEALHRSGRARIFVAAHNRNPGLDRLVEKGGDYLEAKEDETKEIARWAKDQAIGMAVIGMEDALEAGLSDRLQECGIPTIGPVRAAARLETSKLFTRELMRRHGIPGQIAFQYFTDAGALRDFLRSSGREFALKPVGLTAGKGVRVMGVQLRTVEEAIEYGASVIQNRIGNDAGIVVEERVEGPEFTLQVFVDGRTVLPMPLVRDFKRAFEGDQGPNTGGMGSYSQADGLLPFVTREQRDEALDIIRKVVAALRSESAEYKGILYGQFMLTDAGTRLIEMNARFGDPEAVNVLPLLENDFVAVCEAITAGALHEVDLRFAPKATVCKYIAPPNYGSQPRSGVRLRFDEAEMNRLGARVYYAKVNQDGDAVLTTTSRSAALLGQGGSIAEAEACAEKALGHVHGDYHVRRDIGKPATIPAPGKLPEVIAG